MAIAKTLYFAKNYHYFLNKCQSNGHNQRLRCRLGRLMMDSCQYDELAAHPLTTPQRSAESRWQAQASFR